MNIKLITIRNEISSFLTYWRIRLLDLLGWSATSSLIRAKSLQLMGYKIGNRTRIMPGITIHSKLVPLAIGEGTFVNKNVFFDVGNAEVSIGEYCDIGFNTVFSNAKHTLKSNFKTRRAHEPNEPICVGDYVWIGCNCVILGGVNIGKGSVIAAGSVVIDDIPEKVLAGGIPAKVLREL